jgi:hypothetical protein
MSAASFYRAGIACIAVLAFSVGLAAEAAAASAQALHTAPEDSAGEAQAAPARGKRMDPTDAAFAALLSMPGAAPETGEWKFDVPEAFHGKTEQQLIRWLEQKKKEGANFNAYRHYGTLLHHAIRSHLEDTALWLLQHGADPRLKIGSSYDYGAVGENTLSLAVERKQLRVAAILRQPPYSLAPPSTYHVPGPVLTDIEALVQKATPQDLATPASVRRIISSLHTFHSVDTGMLGYAKVLASNRAVLERIPASAFPPALDDDETMKHWFGWISTLAPKDFAEYLNKVPQPLLQSRIYAALHGMSQRTRVDFARDGRQGKNPVDQANWRRLIFSRMPKALDSSLYPPLLPHIETNFWPTLFERGYRIRNAGDELAAWMSQAKPEEFRQLWPLLLAQAPSLRQEGIRLLLKNFTPGSASDCGWEWTSVQPQLVEKAQFLVAQGVEKPRLELNPQCIRHSKPEIIKSLTALGAIKPFEPPAKPRFVPDTALCKFTFNDVWYQALYRNPVITDSVYIDAVRVIDFPGESECALLVSGEQSLSPYYGGPHDGFTGPYEDPVPSCPDPVMGAEVWRLNRAGRIEKHPAEPIATYLLAVLRDTTDGHRYLLATTSGGRCSSDNAFLLDWSSVKGEPTLAVLEARHPAWQGFVQQVDPGSLAQHPPFRQYFPEVADAQRGAAIDARRGGSVEMFVDAHRSAERAAYLKAVQDLDKPVLKAMEAGGVPSWWTREALRAVSTSATLQLAEKRQRMAWLFKNHKQLAQALSSDIADGMVAWLPREDWWPILKVWPGVSWLVGTARAQGKEALACDFEHATGLMCGETWNADGRNQ